MSSKTTEAHGSAETIGQSQETSGDRSSPGQEDSEISTSAETRESAETTGQSQEKSGISRSPGQEDSESSMTAKRGRHRVTSGKEKSHTTKNPRKKNSESSQTTEAHGSAEISTIVMDETRKNNDDCTRCGVGSKVGKKRSGEDVTFPVKRAPLGMCWQFIACALFGISGIVYYA